MNTGFPQYDDANIIQQNLCSEAHKGSVGTNQSDADNHFASALHDNSTDCSGEKDVNGTYFHTSQDHHDCPNEHHCLTLSILEYEKFTKNLPVVEKYSNEWNFKPAHLNRICAINMRHQFCNLQEILGPHNLTSQYPSEFMVPPGMPFYIHNSKKFGDVYCTPFFSVIPANVVSVPSEIFSLSKLSLSRVINNHVYRHELAFNPNLLIEPPRTICEISASSHIWVGLRYEIADLLISKSAKAPFPLVAEILTGMKSLMLSVLPSHLAPYILHFYDPSRLHCSQSQESKFWFHEFIEFTRTVLEASILSIRRFWIGKMSEHFERRSEDISQVVWGLKTIIGLLNITKIDHINGQLKRRIPVLRHNTIKMEKIYFRKQLRSGKISKHQFSCWLRKPSSLDDVPIGDQRQRDASKQPPALSSLPADGYEKDERILGRLVTGFLSSFLSSKSTDRPFSLFNQDKSRILNLEKRFSQVVFSQVDKYVSEKTSNSSSESDLARRFLLRSDVQRSLVYQRLEHRNLCLISQEIYQNLVLYVTGNSQDRKKGEFHDADEIKLSPDITDIVQEVTVILLLHWTGAGDLYGSNGLQVLTTASSTTN